MEQKVLRERERRQCNIGKYKGGNSNPLVNREAIA